MLSLDSNEHQDSSRASQWRLEGLQKFSETNPSALCSEPSIDDRTPFQLYLSARELRFGWNLFGGSVPSLCRSVRNPSRRENVTINSVEMRLQMTGKVQDIVTVAFLAPTAVGQAQEAICSPHGAVSSLETRAFATIRTCSATVYRMFGIALPATMALDVRLCVSLSARRGCTKVVQMDPHAH